MDGGPTQPPNPAGRRALEQEYEQATDAAGAVEDDRKTGAWLWVGCTMSPTLHPHDRGRAVLAHVVVCR